MIAKRLDLPYLFVLLLLFVVWQRVAAHPHRIAMGGIALLIRAHELRQRRKEGKDS